MAKLLEVLLASEETRPCLTLSRDPEAPGSPIPTGDHDRPGAPRISDDRVLVIGWPIADGEETEVVGNSACTAATGASITGVRCVKGRLEARTLATPAEFEVGVSALHDKRDEPPGMIVSEPLVVGTVEVVDTEGADAQVQDPTTRVGTFGIAKLLAPGDAPLYDEFLL